MFDVESLSLAMKDVEGRFPWQEGKTSRQLSADIRSLNQIKLFIEAFFLSSLSVFIHLHVHVSVTV